MIDEKHHIIVVDDHPIYREGLADIVADVLPEARISQAGTFDDMLTIARGGNSPSTFVLDLMFPGMQLESCVALLRVEFPLAAIVIVTMADDPASVERILNSGVDGFLSKAASYEAMKKAFMALADGEFVNLQVDGNMRSASPTSRFVELTSRQLDVLKLVGKGMSNKEIARALALSPFTIRIHLSAIFKTLGVNNRSAVAALAAKYGI
jgi:DNA-binding NarL/FixJ family response regulator